MYKIVQILNNNVAIVRLPDRTKAIAMGKGLVFGKHKGDSVTNRGIEQIFLLNNKESEKNFSDLLKDVPVDFVTVTYEIIDIAIKKYNYLVEDYIYITLANHVYSSYLRLKNHSYQESMVPDMQATYPVEYKIAKESLEIINERLKISLPKTEVKNLVLHFINAKSFEERKEKGNVRTRTTIFNLVQDILKEQGIFRTTKNSLVYDRLMIHLNYFIDRIDSKKVESLSFSKQINEEMQDKYPQAYLLANKIYNIIKDELNLNLGESEMIYLAIHFQRLMNEEE